MIDNQQVGKNMMLLRLQKGLSQQGLAEICNVTHQAVSKWENGAALPDMQTMLFLSKYYQIPMEDILSGEISMDEQEKEEQSAALPAMEASALDALPAPEEETAPPPDAPDMAWSQIAFLAPFASQEALEKLILNQLSRSAEAIDWHTANKLLPFVRSDVLEGILDRCDLAYDENVLGAVAPFVSAGYLEKIVKTIFGNNGKISLKALNKIVPFLPQEAVDQWILRGLQSNEAAPIPRET